MARARFNATILNVNADPLIRSYTTDLLRRAGFHVYEASTGAGALSAAVQDQPDVILLGAIFPDASGPGLCARIRQHPSTASIMLLQSAEECTSAARAEALETGADGLVTEPADADELIATINALVRIRWHREQLCERVDELEKELRDLMRTATEATPDSQGRRVNGP